MVADTNSYAANSTSASPPLPILTFYDCDKAEGAGRPTHRETVSGNPTYTFFRLPRSSNKPSGRVVNLFAARCLGGRSKRNATKTIRRRRFHSEIRKSRHIPNQVISTPPQLLAMSSARHNVKSGHNNDAKINFICWKISTAEGYVASELCAKTNRTCTHYRTRINGKVQNTAPPDTCACKQKNPNTRIWVGSVLIQLLSAPPGSSGRYLHSDRKYMAHVCVR